MTACHSFLYHCVLQHFCSGMCRNQNFWESDLHLWPFRCFLIFFFAFPFFFLFLYLFTAVINLLLGLLPVKKFWESIIEMGKFYHGVATESLNTGNFATNFSVHFLNIFVHNSGSTELITLIRVSWERSFPPVEFENNELILHSTTSFYLYWDPAWQVDPFEHVFICKYHYISEHPFPRNCV